jgi:LuxR family quorum-sensing system transcriptional regulator CciR
MSRLVIAEAFLDDVSGATNGDEILAALMRCCAEMNVRYFALTHHVDFSNPSAPGLRLHNYPSSWQNWFDENHLGQSDPVHRASQLSSIGFPWSAVPRIIKLTPADRSVLSQARLVGIGDGFTVPGHVPGEINGSCSFAVDAGEAFPDRFSNVAQLIGGFSFEAARRVSGVRDIWEHPSQMLTDRQRDCVLWAARGKTDFEISVILNISHETVIQHLKHARERYGVQKRAMLAVRALFDGLISFADIFRY